jgi:hypothetical protein
MRLTWGIGDRGSTITVRVEVSDDGGARVHAYEAHHPSDLWTSGQTMLSGDEARKLLALEKEAAVWSLPSRLPELPPEGKTEAGIETVLICYEDVTLAFVSGDKKQTLNGRCPDPLKNKRVIALAQGLIKVAKAHFSAPWRQEALQ